MNIQKSIFHLSPVIFCVWQPDACAHTHTHIKLLHNSVRYSNGRYQLFSRACSKQDKVVCSKIIASRHVSDFNCGSTLFRYNGRYEYDMETVWIDTSPKWTVLICVRLAEYIADVPLGFLFIVSKIKLLCARNAFFFSFGFVCFLPFSLSCVLLSIIMLSFYVVGIVGSFEYIHTRDISRLLLPALFVWR